MRTVLYFCSLIAIVSFSMACGSNANQGPNHGGSDGSDAATTNPPPNGREPDNNGTTGGGSDSGQGQNGSTTPPVNGSDWTEQPRDRVHLFLSGHSLFNLWMPNMLSQIAAALGRDHHYNIQMGLGSNLTLRAEGGNEQDRDGNNITFNVMEEIANATTIGSGRRYDTLMLTDSVPLWENLLWTDSVPSARLFHGSLMESDPNGRVFLYDSWDGVQAGDFAAWVDTHRRQYVQWECLASAINRDPAVSQRPLRMIPGGVVLAHVVEATANGQVPGIDDPAYYFDDDHHHLSNAGNYVIALAVYAALYARSPAGAPHHLEILFGAASDLLPSAESAAAIQDRVWDFVRGFYASPPNTTRSMQNCREALVPFCDGNQGCINQINERFAD